MRATDAASVATCLSCYLFLDTANLRTGRGAACHTGRKSCFYRIVENAETLRQSGEPRLFDPAQVYKS